MFKRLLELNGTLTTADEINRAWREATGDPEPWATGDSWQAWVEYEDGKTYILSDEG